MRETDDQTGQLLARARSGDGEAFAELTGPFRRELQVHCYRILGSAADAEDMLQETMMAAWRGLDRFEERSSLRTWLHAIAANKCLNHLRASRSAPPPPAPARRPRRHPPAPRGAHLHLHRRGPGMSQFYSKPFMKPGRL